jgi:hypothetical protein
MSASGKKPFTAPSLNMINGNAMLICGPGSSVDIATGYGRDGPGIESRWGARFSSPVQTGPETHPASCTMGTGSLPGVKSDRGVTLTPHPLLVPCSRKGRAIPLLPLWAVRPVQSLSACTSVTFTFYLTLIAKHRTKSAWTPAHGRLEQRQSQRFLQSRQ